MIDQAEPVSDELLLAIIHDIRAYLRRSLTSAQLLEMAAGKSLEASARERLKGIIESNKDLERFLGRLADFANAGYLTGGRPLPLPAVLQAALLPFPGELIQLDPIPAGAANITLPQESIRVFTELIDNALKFSTQAAVEIKVAVENDQSITVRIADSGIGISAKDAGRAFDLLTRFNSGDRFPGFGIGLAICRRTAKATAAGVRLEPNPRGGTIAAVTLGGPSLPVELNY